MKYLIIIFFPIILISTGLAFSPPDSTNAGRNGQQVKEQARAQEKVHVQGQVQEKLNNRINMQNELKQNKRGKDVFIDKDGDGICDQRVKGMGFKRGQNGHKQNGKTQGNGGNDAGGNGNGNGHK